MTRAEIAELIPHAGAMLLLDRIVRWDARRICCTSFTHRDTHNPLRSGGSLPAVCGIEYASQAMAAHGGLVRNASGKPSAGYLISLRDVACRRSRLDDLDGELVVEAELVASDGRRATYRFALRVGEADVLSGRATVVLDAAGARG